MDRLPRPPDLPRRPSRVEGPLQPGGPLRLPQASPQDLVYEPQRLLAFLVGDYALEPYQFVMVEVKGDPFYAVSSSSIRHGYVIIISRGEGDNAGEVASGRIRRRRIRVVVSIARRGGGSSSRRGDNIRKDTYREEITRITAESSKKKGSLRITGRRSAFLGGQVIRNGRDHGQVSERGYNTNKCKYK